MQTLVSVYVKSWSTFLSTPQVSCREVASQVPKHHHSHTIAAFSRKTQITAPNMKQAVYKRLASPNLIALNHEIGYSRISCYTCPIARLHTALIEQ